MRAWLALSAERDYWQRRVIAAEKAGYRRGYRDGAALASLAIAEIEDRYEQIAQWRRWTARVREMQQPPGVRMQKAMREIKSDMDRISEARAKPPWRRSPLDIAVLSGARFEDPGDAA